MKIEKKTKRKQILIMSSFLISVLLIVVGISTLITFLIKGYLTYLVVSLLFLVVGALLLMIVLLATRDYFRELKTKKEKAEKAENQDKLYEKDGWESYGGGLHQYRPHN